MPECQYTVACGGRVGHTRHVTGPEDDDRDEGPEPDITLVVDWSAAGHLPVEPANQFLAQSGPNDGSGQPEGLYLSIGHAAPPILFGSEEMRRATLEELKGRIAINAYGRYFLTRDHLRQLIEVLIEAAKKMDAGV